MWPWQKGRQPSADGPSFIGPGVRIRGGIESEGDLTICGRVEGDIRHDGRLVIGPGAQVVSNIRALQMQVAGEVRGNIQVQDSLELLSTARVYGDIWCAALEVANGAVFFGTNHMAGATELLPAQAAAPAPSAPEPVAAPLSILLQPVGIEEKAVLGAGARPAAEEQTPPPPAPVVTVVRPAPAAEAPAFHGGFAGAMRSEAS